MGLRGSNAAQIACDAGLLVVRVAEPEVVRLMGSLVQIGPGASDRKVIEAAYRYWLSGMGEEDEETIARCVAKHEQTPASTRGSGLHEAIAASR